MEKEYRNIGFALLALPPIFIAGFWIPYFSQIPNFDRTITLPVHAHALLLFAWIVLLVVQPFAIRTGAFALHRLLGRLSYVLMPLIVISTAAMVHKEYHENLDGGMNAHAALAAEFLSVSQLALLSGFYCSAVIHIKRRNVAAHMRAMICIALILLPAGLARTFGYWFGVRQSSSQTYCLLFIDFCLLGFIWSDRKRHLVAHTYVRALAAYATIEVFWFALGRPT